MGKMILLIVMMCVHIMGKAITRNELLMLDIVTDSSLEDNGSYKSNYADTDIATDSITLNDVKCDTCNITETSNKTIKSSNVSNSRISLKQFIIPTALMAYGTLEVSSPKHSILNRPLAREVRKYNSRKCHIDDYAQYLPAASMYILKVAGVKSQHNLRDQTIILGISAIYTAATVNALKYTVKEMRPDNSSRNSFPSGHTAVSFMGAELLWQEYKESSPWYGVTGYVMAASVGALRIYNNRHWLGDVFFGAGLGMTCTKLAYLTYSSLHKKFTSTSTSSTATEVTLCPYYTGNQGGLAMVIQF